MIQQINQHLADIMAERSLDWRSCFTSVVSRPPDGRTIVCECSDADVLAELRVRMASDADEAAGVSYVALPSASEALPAGLIASSSVADVRRAPNHASELVTQIIYGDAVEPLKTEGDWFLVRLDDGYIGWIRSWHLSELSPYNQANYAEVARSQIAVNHAVVVRSPDGDALAVTDLVIGTPVEVLECGRRGWRAVRLPDGKEGFISARSIEKIPVRKRISREKLSSTALRFLGIPYIWGGTTPKGFDCSGLIQRVFRLNGVVIPRDADQQSRFGQEKPARSARDLATGDLIFIGKTEAQITHVAMILPEALFLHAFGQVRVGSLDPRSPLHEAKLIKDWQISRDIVSYCK
jgi:SH3-like domain-containing protein